VHTHTIAGLFVSIFAGARDPTKLHEPERSEVLDSAREREIPGLMGIAILLVILFISFLSASV
jgi:hypothetical protein